MLIDITTLNRLMHCR